MSQNVELTLTFRGKTYKTNVMDVLCLHKSLKRSIKKPKVSQKMKEFKAQSRWS